MKNHVKLTALGVQHLLAMYAGAVIVPLIIGSGLGLNAEQLTYLVSIDILMCGVATLLQVMRGKAIGIGLPVVLGCTFTAVGPIIAIGNEYGITAVYGAILVSGVFVLLTSRLFGHFVKFFPPVVTGSVVTIIGITLIPVAVNNMGGGEGASDFGSISNISLAFGTLFFIILLYKFSTGFIRSISILIGMLGGTMIAAMIGKVDVSPVREAAVMHVAQPFYFGMPTFEWSAIITMILVAMVSLVESTGVYFALGDICEKEVSKKDLVRGYRAEGLAIVLGGIFHAFPYTAFSQNVGLMQMTGVRSRKVIGITGVLLIVLGFFPKVAALTTIIPPSVLGGAMIAMFGMVVSQGIKMLSQTIFDSQENAFIVACAVGMGLGVTVVPDIFHVLPSGIQILTSNGIVAGSFTAISLHIIFNMLPSMAKKNQPMTD